MIHVCGVCVLFVVFVCACTWGGGGGVVTATMVPGFWACFGVPGLLGGCFMVGGRRLPCGGASDRFELFIPRGNFLFIRFVEGADLSYVGAGSEVDLRRVVCRVRIISVVSCRRCACDRCLEV